MSKENYLTWAQAFVQSRDVVAVSLDEATGEYRAISQSGSSFFLERREQAEALVTVLGRPQALQG